MIDSLNPDVMRKNIRNSKAEVNANTEAVDKLNTLIGATPLETGKTVTSELADHESRIDSLESGGGAHIYDLSAEKTITTTSNGALDIAEGHELYGKNIMFGGGYSSDNGVGYWHVQIGNNSPAILNASGTPLNAKTLSSGHIVYFD